MKTDWKGLCTYIVEHDTLPSTKTAEKEYGLPFGKWFELSTRGSKSLAEKAKEVLARLEAKGEN